ncbi:MAG TPA: aminotransferase class V-fold PLP-dependent enzyme [Gammaproteobacteria bacterium]|nr:aminotransferase class V-fold PLP-dependent enzyme [Gammaproteobacteria bacterium]
MHTVEDLIREEFRLDERIVYLNHAAVAPWPERTANAVRAFAGENTRTGAKYYPQWTRKETELREQLRELINAPSVDDIALLKNTSEALSVVASGIHWQAGDNVVSTDQEFPSNRIVWQALDKHGVEFREVDINPPVDPEAALLSACDKNTRLLTVSSVQYGSGIRLDLERLGAFCRKNKILFCVDAIQSIGAHRLDVTAIGADFAMADGHKWMLGPEGLAVFYCSSNVRNKLELYQYGWHMVENASDYDARDWEPARSARRFECGSPNMLAAHALSASVSLLLEVGIAEIERRILQNTSYLVEKIREIDNATLLTPVNAERRAGIVTFTLAGQDMTRLHRHLLDNNVICAHRAGGIRFSPHFYTSQEKIDNALEVLSIRN